MESSAQIRFSPKPSETRTYANRECADVAVEVVGRRPRARLDLIVGGGRLQRPAVSEPEHALQRVRAHLALKAEVAWWVIAIETKIQLQLPNISPIIFTLTTQPHQKNRFLEILFWILSMFVIVSNFQKKNFLSRVITMYIYIL